MLIKPEAYHQNINRLIRATREKLFRFIIIQYSHHDVIDDIRKTLKAQYPERKVNTIRTKMKSFSSLIDKVFEEGNDFILIPDFEYAINRKEIYLGFNQRRDKIAELPISLIAFVPVGNEYIRTIQEKIPDFWSFRTMVLNMPIEFPKKLEDKSEFTQIQSTVDSTSFNAEEEQLELDRLLARIDTLPDKEHSLKINLMIQAAEICDTLGFYEMGQETIENAHQLCLNNNINNKNRDIFAQVISKKATFLKYLGDYKRSVSFAKQALDIARKIKDNKRVVIYSSNLALVYSDLGENEKSRDLLEQALKLGLANFGENHPNVAISRSNLGTVYSDMGEYEKALDLLKQALKSDLTNFGENHPKVAVRQSNLANLYRNLGEYKKAQDLLEQALKSNLANFGEKHPKVAVSQSNLANVYSELGEYEKARDLLEQALKSDLANFGEKHPTVAVCQSNLANVYRNLGEYEKARDLLEQALQSGLANFGENHPDVAIRQWSLGAVFEDLGEYEKAKELYIKAQITFKDILGEKHPHTIGVTDFLRNLNEK